MLAATSSQEMSTAADTEEIAASEESRAFQIDELFFSTTDKKGLIGKANHVFMRVSAFSADELRNKPHNIIRHPDMPRVVFKVLWEYIEDSRPIVAYVKNRAKDGRYYWVVALVSPTAEGYLSVRFKPSSPLLSTVEGLYRHLRKIEKSIEQSGKGKPAAIAASRQELHTQLRSLGFANYDEFMYLMFQQELQSREAGLASIGIGLTPRNDAGKSTRGNSLHSTIHSCNRLLTSLNPVFADLASYFSVNKQIRSKCESVTSLSMSIRMLALNGAIDAEKLGTLASGIGKILDWLQSLSNGITAECESLSTALAKLILEVNGIIFNLGAAKLQIAMTGSFASELLQASSTDGGDNDRGMTDGAIEMLHASFSETTKRALASFTAASTDLLQLRRALDRLKASARSLRSVYVTGKIEMANLESSQLKSIFSDLGSHLRNAEANLQGLDEQIDTLQAQLQKTVRDAEGIDALIADADKSLLGAAAL